MKKVFTFCFIAISSFSLAQAENILSKLKMGVKAEANFSGLIVSDMPNTKTTMQPGANLGTFIRVDITENFAIQEDIMFTYTSSQIKQDGSKDRYEYFGSEIPFYLMGQWKTQSRGRFYGGAGVYFGLGFSAKMKDSNINLYKKYNDEKPAMKRLTNGLAAQIGYEFSNKIQINLAYKYGFNVLDADKKNSKLSPQSLSLGIGYSF